MDEILAILSNITAASALKFILSVVGCISVIAAGTVKVYKMFEKYRLLKNQEEERNEKLEEVYESVTNLKGSYDKFIEATNRFHDESIIIDTVQIRHSIVRACEDSISKGHISNSQLKSIEELYEVYSNTLHQNSYVTDLVSEVRELHKQDKLNNDNKCQCGAAINKSNINN